MQSGHGARNRVLLLVAAALDSFDTHKVPVLVAAILDLFDTDTWQANPKEDIVILIDPDCMFVRYLCSGTFVLINL